MSADLSKLEALKVERHALKVLRDFHAENYGRAWHTVVAELDDRIALLSFNIDTIVQTQAFNVDLTTQARLADMAIRNNRSISAAQTRRPTLLQRLGRMFRREAARKAVG
jgi:hypothetical protein